VSGHQLMALPLKSENGHIFRPDTTFDHRRKTGEFEQTYLHKTDDRGQTAVSFVGATKP
jgi:hypothetical protein